MAGESDQTRWVGTRKVHPAVADLQAVESFVRKFEQINNVGAPSYDHDLYTVPAGKILRLEFLQCYCWQADPTAVGFVLRLAPNDYQWYTALYGGAFEIHYQVIPILYNENEIVRIHWNGTLATTDVVGQIFGHLFDRY